MDNYAIVIDGVVDNVVVWSGDTSEWSPPAGSQAVIIAPGIEVSIGFVYDGTSFKASPRS